VFFPADLWFRAFLLTVVVELPVAGYLLRDAAHDNLRLLLLVVFANLATHPVVWFVATQVLEYGTPSYTLGAEVWAVAAEAVFYWAAIRGLSARRALAASAAANAASFAVGLLVGIAVPGVLG
jgi:hypothetical protein